MTTARQATSRPEAHEEEEAEAGEEEYLSERDLLVYRVQLCEHAGRFDEMAELMKIMCYSYDNLTVEERNLLSCAYKNVIGSRRTSCRVLNETFEASTTGSITAQDNTHNGTSICDNNKGPHQFNPVLIKSILSEIKLELKKHCNDILKILTERLIPSVSTVGESQVFYYKMKGDYTRYLCETCSGLEREEKANKSLTAYKTASDKAMIELPPTHPVRLGLMLNFSVFYHEIMKSPERSCKLAKQAFDDAIAELDTLSEESYRDSTIIMQLLRDNLNLWQAEQILQPVAQSDQHLMQLQNPNALQFKQLQQVPPQPEQQQQQQQL